MSSLKMLTNEDLMDVVDIIEMVKTLEPRTKERFCCVMLGASMMAELMEQPPEPPEEKKVG